MLNSSRIIRLFADRTLLRTFVQYLMAFYGRQKAPSDVLCGNFVWPIVPDKGVKFRDPYLSRSGESQFKAVGCGNFGRFSNFDNSGALDNGSMDIPEKFRDFRLNSGRMIRLFDRPNPFYALLCST